MATLIQRKNGIWTAVFSYRGRRVWRTTGTRDREHAKMIAEQIGCDFIEPKNITVSRLWDILMPVLPASLSASTIKLDASAFKTFIRICGDLPLPAITPYTIEQFKVARLNEVSPEKTSIDFRSLRASLNRARKMKLLVHNPFMDCQNIRIPEKEQRCFSEEELTKVLSVINEDMLARIVMIAAATGMRVGEILSLQWQEVNLMKGEIHLTNRRDFQLKNRRSRVVMLGRAATFTIGCTPKRSAYVFSDEQGRPFKTTTISVRFKRAVRKAGLSDVLHFHSLRHFNASQMSDSGVPFDQVQRLLGHLSSSVTQNYIHSNKEQLWNSIRKLDPIMDRLVEGRWPLDQNTVS